MTQTQIAKRIHPLVATAAVSIILVSLVGVAAITGLLPNSSSSTHPETMMGNDGNHNNVGASVAAPGYSDANVASNREQQKSLESSHVSPNALPNSTSHVTTHAAAKQIESGDFGVVESVRTVEHQAEKGSGLGAAAGAILGGVLGHQVGGGKGRDLATVAGAVGGGLAGNEIEKRKNVTTTYEVRVRMENGNIRTFTPSSQPDWRSGDRVKIVEGHLVFR